MPRKTWSAYCVGGYPLVMLYLASPSLWGQTPGEKESLGKAAIAAHAANIDSFTFYQCRYRHTKAQARSIEAAIRGDYLNARFYDNRLIVDDNKDLYEGYAPPPDPKQASPVPGMKGTFAVSSPGCTDRYLADGKREMNYSPDIRAINLFSVESRVHSIIITPLGMHFLGHRSRNGPNARLNQPDRFDFSVDGFQEIEGHPVLTVRFKLKEVFRPRSEPPIEYSYTYSFDGSRGHIPIRMQMLWNGRPKSQVFVTHIRECSNQRWFPERWVEIVTPDKPGDLFDVSEMKLLDLDADHRPGKSEFFVTVPGGTSVQEFAKPDARHFFTLKQQEKIGIEDIPKLFEMCEQAANTPLMDTAIPHSSIPAWIRWSVGLAGLILVSGGVYFLARRIWLKRIPA